MVSQGNKIDFETLKDNQQTFEEESNNFAGQDITLKFQLKCSGEHDGKEFEDTFKEGQDFEFVKYKLAQGLEISPECIELYHKDTKIVPLYSICDIELGPDDLIIVQILE